MFHKSELKDYGHHFPHDEKGYVPTHGDNWREMKFDHADQDPDEEGISEEERARRIKYLDEVWWPEVLGKVGQQHRHLEKAHGESFVDHWQRFVNQDPPQPHGFQAGPGLDED